VSTFEETLDRVLDPNGVYWNCCEDEESQASAERTVQLRIDVPSKDVAWAVAAMQRDGWTLTEQPDEPGDPQQRLFFQRRQNLLPETKVAMLTNALRVVFPIEGGRLWTWIIVEDENVA
jgi:hypothetical protein